MSCKLSSLVLVFSVVAVATSLAADDIPIPASRPDVVENFGPFAFDASRPTELTLSGDISDEAPAVFQRTLRTKTGIATLVLTSRSGSLDPALLLAKEVRSRGLATHIPAGEQCISVCAFVFLAGTRRTADGKLGAHQIPDTGDASGTQLAISDLFVELRKFGTPDLIIADMLRTPVDSPRMYTPVDLAALGLTTGERAADQSMAPPAPPVGLEGGQTSFGDRSALALTETPDDVAGSAVDPLNIAGTQALLLEASDTGSTGAVPFSGTVEWVRGVDEAGQPTVIGKAHIPARNLRVELQLRKGAGEGLAEAQIIEVRFQVSDTFVGGAIVGLPGVLMKNEELVQGAPLKGVTARIVDNLFVLALSTVATDVTYNSNLLAHRNWMDLALIYSTGKRAIITLEIDQDARQEFAAVISDQAAIQDNVSVVSKSPQSAGVPIARSERVVVVGRGGFKDTLLKNGFDNTTYELVAQTLRNVLAADRMPEGVRLRILMGPSRISDDLIPYRLSVYSPSSDGGFRHIATAALADRGVYVLGEAPPAIEYDGQLLGDLVGPASAAPLIDQKGDRLKP